ncbi:hypothetical protein [Leptospira yasudae]|uniref:hypothetical protein n=1 Tax=Leptospira yasudae TaxID=2202201 RepID=UPI00142DFA44|nr:hypothetical protein [Leptospira yasudae]
MSNIDINVPESYQKKEKETHEKIEINTNEITTDLLKNKVIRRTIRGSLINDIS